MKSSAFLAACGAVLCAAGPILQARRILIETETVIEWVTITVTEGETATIFHRPGEHPNPTTIEEAAEPSTTSSPPPPPPPPPPPAPTTIPEVVVQPTPDPAPEPAPAPSPDPAPQPAPEPSPEPSPEPAPKPAPKPSPDPEPNVQVPEPEPEPVVVPPPATQQAPPAQPTDYVSTALHHHNVHRFNHSSGALEWSEEHAQYAAVLAQRCKMAHDTSIGGGGYGQNLAMWASSDDNKLKGFGPVKSLAKAATNGWYNGELNDFTYYGNPRPDMSRFKDWGHMTQLVWKDTKKVGCATQLCPPGTISQWSSYYTVCNYFPAGNMGGAFDKNVLPPQGQPIVMAANP